MGESMAIPENMPQPRNIYLEQIEILKPMLKIKLKARLEKNEDTRPSTSSKNELPTKSLKDLNVIDLTQSPISSKGKRLSNKGKTTSYNSRIDINNQNKLEPGTMLEKLSKAAPYNIFFTTICKSPETNKQPNAVTFTGE